MRTYTATSSEAMPVAVRGTRTRSAPAPRAASSAQGCVLWGSCQATGPCSLASRIWYSSCLSLSANHTARVMGKCEGSGMWDLRVGRCWSERIGSDGPNELKFTQGQAQAGLHALHFSLQMLLFAIRKVSQGRQ